MKSKVFGSIFFLIVLFTGFYIGYNWKKPVFESVIIKTVEKTDKPYERIINQIYTNHTYSDNYNCADFSRDLVKALNDYGYEAEYIKGDRINVCNKSEENCCHAWTKLKLIIFVESTSATILEPDYYNRTYLANNCNDLSYYE